MATTWAPAPTAAVQAPAAAAEHTEQPRISRLSSMASLRDQFDAKIPLDITLSIVVLGASGDLAKKKTFPALFALYTKG